MFAKASVQLLLLSSLAPTALGHSFLQKAWANGVEYLAWTPFDLVAGIPYPNNIPTWYHENTGGGPIKPNGTNTNNIICGKNAAPAKMSAPINAGSDLKVRWWMNGPWPEYHMGPVIDYIAACNGPCKYVRPQDLKFVKIAQKGWLNNSTYGHGYWATNEMKANDESWSIRIPAGLRAGEYVGECTTTVYT
jgi:hypothetical protein